MLMMHFFSNNKTIGHQLQLIATDLECKANLLHDAILEHDGRAESLGKHF